jgi:predicted DNA-binding ribbon-helix-helix protein
MLGFLPAWLLDLPKPLESQFWQEMRTYEEERKMPYGYTIERVGYDRGEVVG